MGIGKRKQVQLIRITQNQAAGGNWEEGATNTYNTWAEISNPSGFRDYLMGQTQLGKTKRFLIRFRFDIFPGADWKVVYERLEYTISEIEKVSEKDFYWTMRGTAK